MGAMCPEEESTGCGELAQAGGLCIFGILDVAKKLLMRLSSQGGAPKGALTNQQQKGQCRCSWETCVFLILGAPYHRG